MTLPFVGFNAPDTILRSVDLPNPLDPIIPTISPFYILKLTSRSAYNLKASTKKIKTLCRHGYGYPDDEHFFLKIMDMSRKEYVRNQLSHKICD